MTEYGPPRYLSKSHSSCPAARLDGTRVMVEGSSHSLNRVLLCYLSLFFFCGSGTSRLLARQSTEVPPALAADELSRRLEAAMEARKAGELGAIGLASEKLIALGLVDMAKLRLDAKAYEEAAKLCRESLEFEDTPETRVELAIVSLYAKKPAEAVEQSSLAAERDPRNALAWNIKGEALLRQEDYAGAAAALSNSLELKQDAESVYALGIAHLGIGEKQKAAGDFSQLLALTGEHGWSLVLVGRAYREAGMIAEAESEFGSALRLDPRTPEGHYYLALTLLQSNAWNPTPEVKSHLHEELKLNSRHFFANYLLGFFATNERNYDEADRYLQLAAKLNPALPEVWLYLGLNAHDRGANRLAETYFRKAIALATNDIPTEHLSIRKAYFGLGRILLSTGRKAESDKLFQKARELQREEQAEGQRRMASENAKSGAGVAGGSVPYIPEADSRNSVATASRQGLNGGEEARTVSRKASDSQSPAGKGEEHLRAILGSSFNDLATAEALQEKYDLAFKHYREAERWDSRIPNLQRNLGLAAFFVGKPAEAIRLLARVVTEEPGDAHARVVLALAYFAAEDFAKTAQTISPIADRALQDPQLGFAWAKSLAETGNKRGAAHALETMEKADSRLSVESLIQFGRLWSELREIARAAQSFRRILLVDPANADAKFALGIALMSLSKQSEAADLFLSVLVDHPDHVEARYQLGRALLQSGNFPEAIRNLEEVTRLQPARLSVHLDLEAAYRKAGRAAEADRERVLCGALKNRRRPAREHELKASPI
ncbi:MAG: hypothetical protein DMG53_14460 [Acidobacteria bacterium]|nr:MAG: hypothetical protein DMG53_14460 [Acidobacteriota bacterium]